MSEEIRAAGDEPDLLPLPLARLKRRALNAKTALDRHHAAFYLFESAVKLLATGGLALAARQRLALPFAERLKTLARPSLGHWWEFLRGVLPVLAKDDPEWAALERLILGAAQREMPRVAALRAHLSRVLKREAPGEGGVRIRELFDDLVAYRNQEMGHGAAGQRTTSFYRETGLALLDGLGELLARLDVLAGRQLVFVDDVRLQPSGAFLIERFSLRGETPRRFDSLRLDADAGALPRPQTPYLLDANDKLSAALHPLARFDAETNEFFFLGAQRGHDRVLYLSYESGRCLELGDLNEDFCALLSQLTGESVGDEPLRAWEAAAAREDAPEASAEEPAVSPVAEPTRLGEFELTARIAKGGMGVVYRAWQPSLSRWVALKTLIHPGDQKSERRFLREFRALGCVDHPNLVRVYAPGTEGINWYYTMELVEGVDLGRVLSLLESSPRPEALAAGAWSRAISSALEAAEADEEVIGRPPTAERVTGNTARQLAGTISSARHVRHVVTLIRDVARAAEALHRAGVIHRDVKPANIMVSSDGERAVLMDLGLAQLLDDADGDLTRTRQFVGTLRYASPEQVDASRRVDARTDVYGLGATLWELLTFRPLHDAGPKTPEADLRQRILFDEPSRPSSLNPRVPRDLDSIVLLALRKHADRRYSSAQELADDLDRWLRDEPVHARNPTLGYLLGKRIRRHRVGLTVTAVILVAILAAAVTAFLNIQKARDQAIQVADVMTIDWLAGDVRDQTPDEAGIAVMTRWLERYDAVAERAAGYREDLESGAHDESFVPAEELREFLRRFEGLVPRRARVIRRLQIARSLHAISIVDAAAAWEECISDVARSRLYEDSEGKPLGLVPQLGLVPLRSTNGFWEFWHVPSGARPEWDDDRDRWLMREETGMVLTLIPGGEARLGLPVNVPKHAEFLLTQEPRRRVRLSPFLISKFEVTQAQWLRATGSNPSYYPAGTRKDEKLITATHPVEQVTWAEGMRVARLWGLQLPDKDSWEYAARGGKEETFHWGNDPSCLEKRENVSDRARLRLDKEVKAVAWDDGFGAHAPVGSLEANAFGIYDLLANVHELARGGYGRQDRAGVDESDSAAMARMRVTLGGSYELLPRRVSFLSPITPGSTNRTIGVRMMRILD